MTREEISKEKHKELLNEQKKENVKNIIKKIIKVTLFIIYNNKYSIIFSIYNIYIHSKNNNKRI